MENIAPTKANLISAKSSLEFSKQGFELLDRKRNVLIRELMEYVDKAKSIQDKINKIFSEAYKSLERASITMGIYEVEEIAMAVPEANDYNILFKSVMGVEVPHVYFNKEYIKPSYGFYKSNTAMDVAYKNFNEVKYLIYELAELENAIYRLAMEVKKTQKRANALENIQIPRFEAAVKNITEVLEEKEREDFFRLKVVKKKK